MKTLYVMRHAKSSWDDASQSDFERPLNERGLKTARFMGELLKKRSIVPQLIVSSPATRARQTAEIVVESAGFGLPIRFDERIYEASANSVFNLVREFDDRYASALIVGHNPGFEQLVHVLTREPLAMPTAGFAAISVDASKWSSLEASLNDLAFYIHPREEMTS